MSDDHPIDQELNEGTLLLEGGTPQSSTDLSAEGLEGSGHGRQVEALLGAGVELPELGPERLQGRVSSARLRSHAVRSMTSAR